MTDLNMNEIRQYLHCQKCVDEESNHQSPRESSRVSVGFTEIGIQVWCERHQEEVVHLNFHKSIKNGNYSSKNVSNCCWTKPPQEEVAWWKILRRKIHSYEIPEFQKVSLLLVFRCHDGGERHFSDGLGFLCVSSPSPTPRSVGCLRKILNPFLSSSILRQISSYETWEVKRWENQI